MTEPKKYIDAEWLIRELSVVIARPISTALDIIKSAPAADIEPRWIPVTERLPEKYGRYLVTLEDEGYRSVMPLYYGRIGRISTFYDSDSEYGDIEYCGIIAWMPLPSTYKEGGQKDD